jgi:hypothetical protein
MEALGLKLTSGNFTTVITNAINLPLREHVQEPSPPLYCQTLSYDLEQSLA